MDKMDVEKIYKEVNEEELAWLNLNSHYDELALHLTKVEHPDKKRLEKIIEDYTLYELNKLKESSKDVKEPAVLRILISDLKKIGEQLYSFELLKKENLRLREIETKLKDVEEIYHKTAGRQDKKLRAVARKLGITKNGKRQKIISQKDIFWEYMSLIKDPDPMDKWKALENLAEKFGLSSSDAARQHAQGYLKKFKKDYELLCRYKELSYFTSNPKNKPNRFDGILPRVGLYNQDTI